MSMKDRIGESAAAVAVNMGIEIVGFLRDIRNDTRLMRENEEGSRHFEIQYGGEAVNGTVLELKGEPIPQGYKFVPEHVVAVAPEKAKLQLFENRNNPANMIEVIANVQEYANVTSGLIIEGPTVLLAVISGHIATGAVSIRVSGQLVKDKPEPGPAAQV